MLENEENIFWEMFYAKTNMVLVKDIKDKVKWLEKNSL